MWLSILFNKDDRAIAFGLTPYKSVILSDRRRFAPQNDGNKLVLDPNAIALTKMMRIFSINRGRCRTVLLTAAWSDSKSDLLSPFSPEY